MDDFLGYFQRSQKYDEKHAETVRKKYLTHTLSVEKKMELYNCAVSGNLDNLKALIEEKKYPLMEECSATGYYWTVMHYAAHYGFVNIVEYILQYYQYNADKLDILNIQSNLGLSPLLISINNTPDLKKKKQIMELYVLYDAIDFSICSKDNDDIFDICKKHNLLEYLFSILRED
jgi:hypothetical protein